EGCNPSTTTKHAILVLAIVGAVSLSLTTQADPGQKKEHRGYRLVDLGTLGGPSSTFNDFSKTINNHGTVVGGADTPVPDPFAPNCFSASCFVQHAFQWEHGVLTDLGALPGGRSSWAEGINETGQMVGNSQNGLIDPLTGTPESVAILWDHGQMLNLGALGGNGSAAFTINNRGQVAGIAANSIRIRSPWPGLEHRP